MGLPLICVCHPTPGLDGADDGLSALVDVNVLNGDLLLALTSVAVQGVEEQGVGARECGVAGPNSTPAGSPKGPERLGEWRAPGPFAVLGLRQQTEWARLRVCYCLAGDTRRPSSGG
jgi:hypothetical protein